jgi:hypothetical protein
VKQCTRCNDTKPLDAFPPRRTTRDGRDSHCRACANAATRAWRAANPETARASRRRWRLADQQRRADQPRPPVQPRVAQRKRRVMRKVP